MLPAQIEGLTREISMLEQKLADPDFYSRDRAGFDSTTARLDAARRELEAAEQRWLELEEKREQLATGSGR